MSLELIPMLLLSLLLMASDGAGAGVARILLSGEHRLDATSDTVVVGDVGATIPAGAAVTAPVYVIGGTTRIDGDVRATVTQIAGDLTVGGDAQIAHLRLIGGVRTVAPTADVGRRTRVDLTGGGAPAPSVLPSLAIVVVLSLVGLWLGRTRPRNLHNVACAVVDHPVITVTVGTLLTLTVLALLVFMAFTLVLIPVSILGLVGGVAALALGVTAWGDRLGRALGARSGVATAAGVAIVVVALHLVGLIPVIGDLVVAFVLLSGLGGVTITYLGFTDFRPAALPD